MQINDSNLPPFPAFACTSRYVAVGAIADALARVSRAIDAREAAALVIGPPGTGKSLLCGLITDQYQSTHDVVILGQTPLDDRDAVLRNLLHRLGVESGASQAGDPHLALVDYINQPSESEGLIVIVDEAQALSVDVIEAIRMVTNITRGGQPHVTVLLCGGVKLDETLVDSSLESFTQRAATRCYLHPLNAQETRSYIHQTIARCGADPEATITDEAIAAIHHACSGVPRLINQLTSQAIDCAADADETLISEPLVDQAWAELQQLPSPMVEQPDLALSPAPIEFGELDDDSRTPASDAVQWSDGGSDTQPRCEDQPQSEPNQTASVLEFSRPSTQSANDSAIAPEESLADLSPDHGWQPAASGHDIHLESTSAVWVDEPFPSDATATDRTAEVPAATAQPLQALFGRFDSEEEISVGSGFAVQARVPAVAPANLESLLQQEMVGVGAHTDLGRGTDVMESDRAVIQMSPRGNRADRANRDDSDLLVIEDEVAVIPINDVQVTHDEAAEVAVDFQAMLTKMRGNH